MLLLVTGAAGCSGEVAGAVLDAALEQMASAEASQATQPADLPSAEASDASAQSEPVEIADLESLHDPEIFTWNALEHIFSGSVNARGVASGYHSEAWPPARGEVVEGTRTEPDDNGVYEGQVRVDGKDKAGNRGYSSFYPLDMPVPDVVAAIREAHASRVFVNGNTWRGEGGGLTILMYLDDNDRIISAFPEYGG
jgi:hypothetical protein